MKRHAELVLLHPGCYICRVEDRRRVRAVAIPAQPDDARTVRVGEMDLPLPMLDGAVVRRYTDGDLGVIATVPFTPARGPNRDSGPSSSQTQGAGPVDPPPDLWGAA